MQILREERMTEPIVREECEGCFTIIFFNCTERQGCFSQRVILYSNPTPPVG